MVDHIHPRESPEVQAYHDLDPDTVLDAVESAGFPCDGRLLALNSYENRVYQVGIESASPLVVKFYRPGRWSDEAILEEHDFVNELVEREIPVVAPLRSAAGESLRYFDRHRFALFPRRGGRAPELDNPDHLQQLGRLLARIHACGALSAYRHRPRLSIEHFAEASLRDLLEFGFIPADLVPAYRSVAEASVVAIRRCFERSGPSATQRIHGDCHAGNILWSVEGATIVDFDDSCTGPVVQDIWMFLSGDRDYMGARLRDFLEGYWEFNDFDPRQLGLIEALRTMRIMHYAAWLARRWDDPSFPRAFPWFNTGRYWEDHILTLREQLAAMDEAPLSLR